MFNVSISAEDNKIFGKLVVDSYFFEEAKYDYAFYLYNDSQKGKLDARWYRDSKEVTFDLVGMSGNFYIRCFIRDKEIKNKRTYDSEKIAIDL
ncbi:hypothetical protein [Psychrobacter cibarius]|uniref:hypothetical protein n=1 Tax=Psychrobacter cibarius TaxID=282669 RepID=UPI001919B41E|nr:hypothetical protein [Psychrobacter cibarius]